MKLNGFDLNKLHVFFAVVKHEGFKGASEELQLTRSALSQSIGSLENTLGVSLFHRVGRRLVPTHEAQRFYGEVREYQLKLQDSVAALIDQRGKASGVLKIGAYLEFAKGKMMPVVEDFLDRNPNAQVKFVFDSPSRLDKLLETQKIDLSISVFPHRGKHKINSRKLYQEELVLVGSPKLISERPKSAHFQKVPVIDYFPTHQIFKRWWALHFRTQLFRGSVRAYAATADMVMEMVGRGLGVGVVPRYVFEGSDLARVVHIIQPTEKRLYDYIWVNEHRQIGKSVVQQSFTKLLSARFSTY